MPEVVIFTGGRLIIRVPGENGTYGNNVTSRPRVQGAGAQKSYIDVNFVLPDSRVLAFYIYSRGASTSDVDGLFYYLQIWRPVSPTVLRFQLVWQQRIQVTETSAGLYTVSTCYDLCIALKL